MTITRKHVFFVKIVLVASFLVGLTACDVPRRSDSNTVKAAPPIAETLSLKATQDAAAKEEEGRVQQARKSYDTVRSSKNLLAQAQGAGQSEFCGEWEKFLQLEELQNLTATFTSPTGKTLATEVEGSLKETGAKVAKGFYSDMVRGSNPSCGSDVLFNTEYFRDTIQTLERYGDQDYDKKVIRAAYLRVLKPELKEALADYKARPESSDAQGSLFWLIRNAVEEWQFSPEELAIPADVMKKYKESKGGGGN